MSEEPTPSWAIPLVKLVERIDQKLDDHKISIQDHETRLREIEATNAVLANVAQAQVRLDESLMEVFSRLRNLEKKVWMAIGALTFVMTALGFVAFNVNLN
jgi:hypothetical protein